MAINFTSAKYEANLALFAGKKGAPTPSKAATKKVAAPISTGEYRLVELAKLKLDQSAQPRETVNNDKIAEYADAMKAGDKFPALVVFENETGAWLADGFHRHYAAQHAGIKTMSCRVLPGGLRDAILYSVGANATHGVLRSDNDKERAVLRLLNDEIWSTWTDREIAKRCRVSHPFVAKTKAKSVPVTGSASSERTYTTKHGTVATMKTAGINAGRKTGGDQPKELTPETVALQGVEGGDESVSAQEELTPSASIGADWKQTDEERQAASLEAAWNAAAEIVRLGFMAKHGLALAGAA